MTSNTLLIDVLGWLGALVLLVAYALVSTRKVEGDSAGYQYMNLGGSVLLMVNAGFYGAYPSAFVNVVWLGIALFTLTRALRKPVPGRE